MPTATKTMARCKCGNIESAQYMRAHPSGGAVCPECCRNFPAFFEFIYSGEEY